MEALLFLAVLLLTIIALYLRNIAFDIARIRRTVVSLAFKLTREIEHEVP